jgi:hypothetical protein
MTNLALISAELERIAADLAALLDLLRERSAQQCATRVDPSSGPFITPGQASGICGRSESQVRRDCEANLIDEGGFGFKKGGRWLVSEPRYREMRGHARLRV